MRIVTWRIDNEEESIISERISNETLLIITNKKMKKIIKVKRTSLCLYFWLAILVYFEKTKMILVKHVNHYFYSILKVVKIRFYNIIYLINFLPYSYFLELQKICVVFFVCFLHWNNKIERKIIFFKNFSPYNIINKIWNFWRNLFFFLFRYFNIWI